jgi:hypothetical protein
MTAAQMPSATSAHPRAPSRSPRWAAAAAFASALAWNSEIDFDTLNVASQYRSGVLTWAFASIISRARRSAVASGSAASNAA